MSTPPIAAAATMLALVTAADSASSVPRASGTCSVRRVVFDAKRAPMTADSARFRRAVASSGGVRFVWRSRSAPESSTLPATTGRWPIRAPIRPPSWLPTSTPRPCVSANVDARPSARPKVCWKNTTMYVAQVNQERDEQPEARRERREDREDAHDDGARHEETLAAEPVGVRAREEGDEDPRRAVRGDHEARRPRADVEF